MDHNDVRHSLSEYIDGTITAGEKAAIEDHLKTCSQCSDALRELKKTVEHIRQSEEVEPPAWMRQKIMARVREEASGRKGLFRRLFFPLHIKLPLEAVGVLFLAVTVYFMTQNIETTAKFSKEPKSEYSEKQEIPPPDIAEEKLDKPDDRSLRSREVPQKPEYKALDMKPAYEGRPAPIPGDKAPAPAAVPAQPADRSGTKKDETFFEKPPVAPQKSATGLTQEEGATTMSIAPQPEVKQKSAAPSAGIRENKAAPETLDATTKQRKSASMPGTGAGEESLNRSSLAERSEKQFSLAVDDVTDSVRQVEKIAEQLEGIVIRKEAVADAGIVTITLDIKKRQSLVDKLKDIGELKEAGIRSSQTEGNMNVEIMVVKSLKRDDR